MVVSWVLTATLQIYMHEKIIKWMMRSEKPPNSGCIEIQESGNLLAEGTLKPCDTQVAGWWIQCIWWKDLPCLLKVLLSKRLRGLKQMQADATNDNIHRPQRDIRLVSRTPPGRWLDTGKREGLICFHTLTQTLGGPDLLLMEKRGKIRKINRPREPANTR